MSMRSPLTFIATIKGIVLGACLMLANAAAAQTLSPEHAAALEDYLTTVRYSAMVSSSIRSMNDYFRANLPEMLGRSIDGQASLSPDEKLAAKSELPRIAEVIARETERYLSDPKLAMEMKNVTMNVMARHFTPDEIREITAFYKTPIGAKVVNEMPQIMTEAMQASMQLTSQRLGSLIENMTREMLAKPAAAPPK